jgi:transforming growth factor-beta-induced protein
MTMRRSILLAAAAILTLSLVAVPVAQARQPGPTIVGKALAVNATSGEFDDLIAALQRAGLVDALDGNRQFTVFAPTDAAFESLFRTLGVSGVDEIPVDTLRAVLLHHVAPGERFSGDVLASARLRMLDKSFTHPAVVGGTPTIDGSRIVAPDIDVSNGVIHVIDAVLLP